MAAKLREGVVKNDARCEFPVMKLKLDIAHQTQGIRLPEVQKRVATFTVVMK
jgi:hypothetical protein